MSHACWTACDPWNCACAAKMRQAQPITLPPVIIEKHFYPKFQLPDLTKPSPHSTPIKPPKQWMPPDGEAMRAEDV